MSKSKSKSLGESLGESLSLNNRRLFYLLIVLLTVLALAACTSSSGRSTGTTGTTTGESVTVSSETEGIPAENTTRKQTTADFPLNERIKLGVFGYYKYVAVRNDMPVIQKLSELTNIEFEWETSPSDTPETYQEVLSTRLSAGMDNLPDIVFIGGNQAAAAARVIELGAAGLLAPLQDIFEERCPEIIEFFEKTEGSREMITAPDGNIYGLPRMDAPYSMASNYMIDKRALEKLGIDYPENIDEFYEMLVKAKAAGYEWPYTPGYKPIHQLATVWGVHLTNYNIEGFWAYDGVVRNDWTSDNLKEFYIFMNKLYNEKLLDPEFDIQTTETQAQLVAAEKIACITVDTGTGMAWDTMLGAVDEPYWAPAPIMTGPYGHQFLIGRRMWDLGNMWCVNANSPYIEEAAMLLAWTFTNPDAKILWEYGIEGLTYEVDENGKISRLYSEGDTQYDTSGVYYPLPTWNGIDDNTLNLFIPSLPKYGQVSRYIDLELEKYYVPPFLSNSSLLDEEIEIYNRYMPDLQTYLSEMMIKFVKGEVSFDKWDDYVNTVNNKRGMSQLVDIKQTQYDRVNK